MFFCFKQPSFCGRTRIFCFIHPTLLRGRTRTFRIVYTENNPHFLHFLHLFLRRLICFDMDSTLILRAGSAGSEGRFRVSLLYCAREEVCLFVALRFYRNNKLLYCARGNLSGHRPILRGRFTTLRRPPRLLRRPLRLLRRPLGLLRRPLGLLRRPLVIVYRYSMSTSQTATIWQTEPARTKKWKTECMYFFLFSE